MMPEDDTVFDISKPNKVGADPNSIPVIVGHSPPMPDPMFRKFSPGTSKSEDVPLPSPNVIPKTESFSAKRSSGPVAIMEGEPLQSPAFEVGGPGSELKPNRKHSPYMPISSMTGIASDAPASGMVDPEAISGGPRPGSGGIVTSGGDTPLDLAGGKEHGRFRLWWLTIPLVAAISVYLALDSGLISNSMNLPFHVFKHDDQTASTTSDTGSSTPAIPAGFSKYTLATTNLYFYSPTAWGVPTAATDPGFSKRGGTNAADGKYAYIVSFPGNQDIQMIFTSSKYLPAARGAQYFDFLQWCIGTNDANYYQSALRFNTANGVDTPATVSCDQGPMLGVTKIDNDTIAQLGTKTTDGKSFGDLYTKNLKDKDLVVVRIQDATSKSADLVKTLLSSINLTQ